ncbi:MAG: nitroreductase family protein [Anaerolineae bacterium]
MHNALHGSSESSNNINLDRQTFLDWIRSRRSIRRYLKESVPRQVIDELLEAARWAPSAHNRQPWRFAVIESEATKAALARAMGERLRTDLARDGAPGEVIEADTARSYARISNAPVVILVCMTLRDMDIYADERRRQAERIMATQSVAMSAQNLLLAAYARGLGACWMCAPLFAPETAQGVLGLDADWEPQALITLGYPAESKTKSRKPLDAIARYLDTEENPQRPESDSYSKSV